MKKQQLTDLLGGSVEIDIDESIVSLPIAGIEVPIIQRDYAQGRPEERLILDRFLGALFEALANDVELELDFVYGSIRADGVFLPLDGQQRLTTLFLLHWYAANVELAPEERKAFGERLKRFRYATRSTASRFCEKLTEVTGTDDVAGSIRGAYWFHKSFEKDPTVIAMLNTIREIELRYQSVSGPLFVRLSKLCFYLLPLDGFSLTDELYIKMNARGKQLTDFENFKADLIGRLKDELHPEKEHFHLAKSHGASVMPYYLALASKMDNQWTDIFWPTAKSADLADGKDRTVDPYFLRFINRYLLNHHIVYAKGSAVEIEGSSVFKELYGPVGNDANLRYRRFYAYEALNTERVMARFEQLMDNLNLHQATIRKVTGPAWDRQDGWFLFDEKIVQTQRILFLAVTLYMEQPIFDQEKFEAWIRVCWNIIIDPDIRSVGAMITAMRTIAKLAAGCTDIYAFLETDVFERQLAETNNIHGDQLFEERKKALLMKDRGWRELILKAEAHYLFQGNIGFLLRDEPDLNLFRVRVNNAFELFDRTGTNKNFRSDHGVYRYVIGSLKSWKSIEQFTYIDDYRNWQLGLRRNNDHKAAISTLCSDSDTLAIQQHIDRVLTRPSLLTTANGAKLPKVHETLYKNEAFVKWTQKAEKVSRIKWLHDRIYLIRPSAWYDKVMIEGYRNEIIAHFYTLTKLKWHDRCGESDLSFGEEISIGLKGFERPYLVHFDRMLNVEVSKQEVIGDRSSPLSVMMKRPISSVQSLEEAEAVASQIYKVIMDSIALDRAELVESI